MKRVSLKAFIPFPPAGVGVVTTTLGTDPGAGRHPKVRARVESLRRGIGHEGAWCRHARVRRRRAARPVAVDVLRTDEGVCTRRPAGQACAWLGVIARRKGPGETETACRGRVGGWPDTRRPPLPGCGRLASHYDESIQQRRGASLEALSVQVTDG